MNTILRTEHLCKFYGSGENEVRAVDDLSLIHISEPTRL